MVASDVVEFRFAASQPVRTTEAGSRCPCRQAVRSNRQVRCQPAESLRRAAVDSRQRMEGRKG
jgi:hypothetical protein